MQKTIAKFQKDCTTLFQNWRVDKAAQNIKQVNNIVK